MNTKVGNIILKITVVCFLCLGAFSKANSQLTLLSIDSIAPLEPLVMNDTADFYVRLAVDDIGPLNIDSLLGNLFYLYQTDSMQETFQLPRIIDLDLSILWVPHHKVDTVPIDIRPYEIRTTPANLIILWPMMINPLILDTNGLGVWIDQSGGMGTLNTEEFLKENPNVVFPCPALQFINIRPEEIKLIRQIKVLSMEGKVMNEYFPADFASGMISVDHLPMGTYFVEVNYIDNKVSRTKIVKRQ